MINLLSQLRGLNIIKFTNNYKPLAVSKKDMVAARDQVSVNQNTAPAIESILQFPSVLNYLSTMPGHARKFQKQLNLYLKTYLSDCPFNIEATLQYSTTKEACIIAREPISIGDIKYLFGILVNLTKEEEKVLERMGRDFSIVKSSRNGRFSLYIGPGRFVNHDCEPNAEFRSVEGGIKIAAKRNINPDEEITVDYSSHYFGVDNRECRCATCQSLHRNGWQNGPSTHSGVERVRFANSATIWEVTGPRREVPLIQSSQNLKRKLGPDNLEM
jgi:hypothetical protein